MKTRADLINYIIKFYNYKSYLEIGCANNKTFNQISIMNKVGVDPNKGGTVRMTSDDFFSQLESYKKFDIVFIDGLHLKEQVLRDVNNSLKHLNKGGTIVIHDCEPMKESWQYRSPRISCIMEGFPILMKLPSFQSILYFIEKHIPKLLDVTCFLISRFSSKSPKRKGFAWTGDVWKAIVELRSYENVDICCPGIDMCAVIQKRPNSDLIKVSKYKLNWKNFCKNKERWIMKKSIKEFKKWLQEYKYLYDS